MFAHHFDSSLSRVEAWTTRSQLLKSVVYPAAGLPLASLTRSPVVYDAAVSFAEATKDAATTYKPCEISAKLGPIWTTHWFKLVLPAALPDDWNVKLQANKRYQLQLRWNSGCEATLWSEDGRVLNSFTGTTDDTQRDTHVLSADLFSGGQAAVVFFVEVATNEMFGNTTDWEVGPAGPPKSRADYELKTAEVALWDSEAAGLLWDLTILHQLAKNLPEDSQTAQTCLRVADTAVNHIIIGDPASILEARAITTSLFTENHEPNGTSLQHRVYAIGNCHIDTAWLWPIRETHRKTARSWSAQLRIAEQYPPSSYQFAISQAQQLEWLQQDYPALFAEVQQAVKRGSFHIVGGTWVEMDCNIPSGESLVRQFLLGQQFFAREFDGVEASVFWLPDTFGYSSQLPQIMTLSHAKYFLTQKLSWNQFNKWPYSTFRWEGLDGTTVLTHFPPGETYTGRADVPQLLKTEKNNKDKDRCPCSMLLFGHGDGGGGPQIQMIERLNRMTCVAKNGTGLPNIKPATAMEFFEACENDKAQELLKWSGELYFELHRGTYTTQAKNKLWNRRCETMLHDIEAFASLAACQATKEYLYPAEEITRLWKLVLLNQFHDIIPGSSINQVYVDSAKQYKEIITSGAKLLEVACKSVASKVPPGFNVFNSLEWQRSSIVEVSSMNVQSLQKSATGNHLVVAESSGLGVGLCCLDTHQKLDPCSVVVTKSTDDKILFVLENHFLRVVINSNDGSLVSLIHKKSGTESIAAGGQGNRFILFEDWPNYWDAWDVDISHLEKQLDLKTVKCVAEVTEKGPLRCCVQVKTRLTEKCTIVQHIFLTKVSERIDFVTQVNWNESHKFLKVEFPFNIHSPVATYETQFGHVQRPTHMNTSWDMAKFEVCGHRWADLSQYGFGVSLLNDCKYGYSALGNVMRLSLLRSPKAPDPEADMGTHLFTYSLFPHEGSFQSAGTLRQAAELNCPLMVSTQPKISFTPLPPAYLALDKAQGVMIEAIKLDETNHKDLIVRLCERFGGACHKAYLFSPNKMVHITTATAVDLLEQPLSGPHHCRLVPFSHDSSAVEFSCKPFQILTIKLSQQ